MSADETIRPNGLLLGGAGVLAFSLTLVAARAAGSDFGVLTVGVGRAVIAADLP